MASRSWHNNVIADVSNGLVSQLSSWQGTIPCFSEKSNTLIIQIPFLSESATSLRNEIPSLSGFANSLRNGVALGATDRE